MTLYDIEVRTIQGATCSLDVYRDKALLIVNVASRCGYTPQYAGLEALYRKYRNRGFAVLGFPCNQFGRQEPATDSEILTFCTGTYDVTFPMFGKVDVNGAGAHPLYRFLKSERPGVLGTEAIKWNFTKFLVDGRGRVVRRYRPAETASRIERDIAGALTAGSGLPAPGSGFPPPDVGSR